LTVVLSAEHGTRMDRQVRGNKHFGFGRISQDTHITKVESEPTKLRMNILVSLHSLLSVCLCVLLTTSFFCMYIHCHGKMFTRPLPSNGRLFWFHCSGFQASCHIAVKSCWTLCFLCGPVHIRYSTCNERRVGD
jgi:hypothetical protein